jgi:hypothetical protein
MGLSVYYVSTLFLFKHLFVPFIATSASAVPTIAPTDGVGLPPQAVPVTFSPTSFLSEEQEAVQFRIKAIAVMFSIAGFVFFFILVHYVYDTLSDKNWEKDDDDGVKNNKWEALEDQESKRRLLEEVAMGIKKPESGAQWDESAFSNPDLPTLEPSWQKEHHIEMQWQNPDSYSSPLDRTLIANPSRWSSTQPIPPVTPTAIKTVSAVKKKGEVSEPPAASSTADFPVASAPASEPEQPSRRLPPLDLSRATPAPDTRSISQEQTHVQDTSAGENTGTVHGTRKVKVVRKRTAPS